MLIKYMRTLILIMSLGLLSLSNVLFSQTENNWTLEKCISYALEQNIQIRKGNLSSQITELNIEKSKAQRFPSVNASIGQDFSWSKTNQVFSGTQGSSYGANTGITLFNYSRINNLIEQAILQNEEGKLNLEATKETISLSILNAYLQVLFAEEQVKNSQKQLESTVVQLDLANERLALQIISTSDYAKVKSQLASEKFTLANSESQLAIAKVNLMQLMELPLTSDFTISKPEQSISLNENRTPNISLVYEMALSIKPQIKSAELNKKIAAIDEKIAKAGYFPVISANAGINTVYSSLSSDSYFTQLEDGIRPFAGLSLSIPIYQKKQVKTNVAIARISTLDSELTNLATKNQLRKEIEQACQDVISAQIEYEASNANYLATLESTSLSDERFSQGIINSVDYLVSKTNLILAESQFLQSKYNLIFSYKILDYYMGIPLSL